MSDRGIFGDIPVMYFLDDISKKITEKEDEAIKTLLTQCVALGLDLKQETARTYTPQDIRDTLRCSKDVAKVIFDCLHRVFYYHTGEELAKTHELLRKYISDIEKGDGDDFDETDSSGNSSLTVKACMSEKHRALTGHAEVYNNKQKMLFQKWEAQGHIYLTRIDSINCPTLNRFTSGLHPDVLKRNNSTLYQQVSLANYSSGSEKRLCLGINNSVLYYMGYDTEAEQKFNTKLQEFLRGFDILKKVQVIHKKLPLPIDAGFTFGIDSFLHYSNENTFIPSINLGALDAFVLHNGSIENIFVVK